MASTYLTKTLGTATNRKKFTISLWTKRSNLSVNNAAQLMTVGTNGGTNIDEFNFYNTTDLLSFQGYESSVEEFQLRTNQKFRDTSAWYHIVVAYDSTQGTASNRIKMYVNGTQVTSFAIENYPDQNHEPLFNSNVPHLIGRYIASSNYYSGIISHINFIDGTAYDATAFGEYDANGVWKIKTSPSVTYGNNGFFILKDGNSVTDQSGNSNNFTVGGGTLTNTEDNPSNVFATMNPLIPSTDFLTNGNNTARSSGSNWRTAYSTLAVSSGKYYFEAKQSAGGNSVDMGICEVTQASYSQYPGQASRSWGYHNNNVIYNNGNTLANVSTYTTGDIISIALDLDNNYVYFGKNGTWQNSGNPTSGGSGTGGFAITSGYDYGFCIGDYNNSYPQANFGNGYFGTTAVSSAGTNASGIGIFEHDVPTGYTALSTKGLNL